MIGRLKNFYFYLLLLLISFLYLFLRLNNLPQTMTFSFDQGDHLLQAYSSVINKKLPLIGPEITSKTYDNRHFFIGPFYTYTLALLGIITSWNPIAITIIFVLFELSVLIFFTFWLRQKFSPSTALFCFFWLTTSNFFIVNSRFIWNPHLLLPLGVFAIITLYHYYYQPKLSTLALFSFIYGFTFSFHFVALIWALPLLLVLLKTKRITNLLHLVIIPFFFILGDLPYFIFEIRNHFYNLSTIYFVFSHSTTATNLEPHYIIYPVSAFFLFIFALILHTSSSLLKIVFISFFLSLNIFQFIFFHPSLPYGHAPGWTYQHLVQARDIIISSGCPKNYNVAGTIDGNTRFYALRFLLSIKNCSPLPVDQYANAQILFLVAPPSRPPQTESVWEVSSFHPFSISSSYNLDNFILYRLDKK